MFPKRARAALIASSAGREKRIALRSRKRENAMTARALEDRISQVIAEAASVIAELVRAEIAERLREAVALPVRGSFGEYVRKRGESVARAKTSRKPGRPATSVSAKAVDQVLEVIKAEPGLRSEQIYQKVSVSPKVAKKVLAKLREAKRVKTSGARRATTYAAA
jgi:hypothetical protein